MAKMLPLIVLMLLFAVFSAFYGFADFVDFKIKNVTNELSTKLSNESDPFWSGNASSLSAGYVPKWNGSSLEDSSIYVTSGGYVGIGTTSPIRRLHLPNEGLTEGLRIGNADLYDEGTWFRLNHNGVNTWFGGGDIYFNLGGDSDSYGKLYIRNASSAIQAWIDSSGNARFNGKVGIGPVSPSYRLHIYDSTSGVVRALVENPSGQASLGLKTTGAYWIWYVAQANGNQLRLWDGVNNADRLVITPAGIGVKRMPSYGIDASNGRLDTIVTKGISFTATDPPYFTYNAYFYANSSYSGLMLNYWNKMAFKKRVGGDRIIMELDDSKVRVADIAFIDKTPIYGGGGKLVSVNMMPYNEFSTFDFYSFEYWNGTDWANRTDYTPQDVMLIFSGLPHGGVIQSNYTTRRWRVGLEAVSANIIYGLNIVKKYTLWHNYGTDLAIYRNCSGTILTFFNMSDAIGSEGSYWIPQTITIGPGCILYFEFNTDNLPTDGVYRIGWVYGSPFGYPGRSAVVSLGNYRDENTNQIYLVADDHFMPRYDNTYYFGRPELRWKYGMFGVGIGIGDRPTFPTRAIEVHPGTPNPIADGWDVWSDKELKEDIREEAEIEHEKSYEKIKKLKTYKFKIKFDPEKKEREGVIADELELIMPEAVRNVTIRENCTVEEVVNFNNETKEAEISYITNCDERTVKAVDLYAYTVELTKALKTAIKKIEKLEAKIDKICSRYPSACW